MRIKYDASANAAMIYFVKETKFGMVKRETRIDLNRAGAMVNLGFDEEGKMVAIEVLHAREVLPTDALNES